MSERTSTAVLDGPLKDTHGSIDTLDSPEVTAIGMPENVETIKDVEAQRDAEARMSPTERMAKLEKEISDDRTMLARMGAKRGTRIRSRTKGEKAEMYEYVHGAYNQKVVELGRLKLAESLEDEDLSADDKKKEVLGYLFSEQQKLREETSDKLEGTPMGKVVKWMNTGGRLKKFMKVAGVGLIAGAAGMATGGLAGGLIAAGVAGGSRMFRGFVAAEGKNGRALNDVDTNMLNAKAFENDAHSLLDAGANALGESFNDEIKGRQKKVRRAFGRGALYAGAGATIGALVHGATGAVAHAQTAETPIKAGEHNMLRPVADTTDVKAGEHVMLAAHSETVDAFAYNPSENPFYAPGKLGIHDMGTPLNADPNLDGGRPAGFNDLTQHRWMDSPEQFASIASAMGIDNLPDNMASANGLAEHFKVAPGDMASMHEKVMGIINDPNTHISTQNIVNPYASEYGVDMGNGNMDLAWDDYVNHGGTKTVIEFTDGNGVRRVLELRNECGGQRIVELPDAPAPVYQETPVYYEQAQYEGTGNGTQTFYNPPEEHTPQPPTPQPPVPQPPTPQPPTPQPPTPQPPTPQPPIPPEVLNPKISALDSNIRVLEGIQQTLGDITSGALQSPGSVTTPGATIIDSLGQQGSTPSTEFAPGADSSPGSIDIHSDAPAAQPGSNGADNSNSERVN